MINDIQKNEFITAEKLILNRAKQINPLFEKFVSGSRNIQNKIDNVENLLLACMNENGTVNGQLLGDILYEKYPVACGWINIPNEDFRLVEVVDNILALFMGGQYDR